MSLTARSTPRKRGLACVIAIAPIFALSVCADAAQAADPKCMTSYENAQLLRQRGKLVDARDAAMVCARATCPDVARKDCTLWVAEIEKEIPSVIVIARDDVTGDEGGARVQVDGVAHPEAGSGRAFPLDPGAHVFRIERAGDEPLEQTITIVQGEHDRILRFALHGDPNRVAAARPPQLTTPSTNTSAVVTPVQDVPQGSTEVSRVTYVPAITVAAVSIVAFGASAFLGVTGRNDLSHLRTTCAPTCADSDVDPVKSKLLASDILLGTGIVGSVIALYFFARPPHLVTSSTSAAPAHVAPTPSLRPDFVATTHGGTMSLGGTF